MARLLILILFVTLVITGSMAMKSCSDRSSPPATPSTTGETGVVALRDGSTMMAGRGTVGRDLVDWLAARQAGQKAFELGGQEFIGRTATPTPESIGRASRLVAMLRANPDVRITIIGHTDPSGDEDADGALGLDRAEALARLLREGGVSKSHMVTESRGSTDPVAPNDSPQGRAKNQRVSLILKRKQ
jgi:outer membrane protein OmpA-like peptidoglycan-associated protein